MSFFLDHRSVAMEGTYAHQVFRSRWAEYDVWRVRSWCDLSRACTRSHPAAGEAACALSRTPPRLDQQDILPADGVMLGA